MKPSTMFLTNVECTDATGRGLAGEIMKELQSRGVQPGKLLSLGSDGASVMTGKHNAILKRQNPHMINTHCIAHRLALCTSQAAESIPMLKRHQQILTDLFYYFKGSAKRAARLHEIQKLMDDPVLNYKEVHAVRWLSFFSALTTVWRTLDSLLSYLAERNHSEDPKAAGLKKKIGTDSFISLTYMLMDAMAPVTILSQFFQTENIDIALVQVKLDNCLDKLEQLKSMKTPYLLKLTEDLTGSTFKDHHITCSPFNLENITKEFADALIQNIKSRFPDKELLQCFGVLSMRPLTFLSSQDLDMYGNNEIDKLCEFYGRTECAMEGKWRQGKEV
ncbi:zinc finger protein 862-like isoform X2 [Argopecten irradians]|uniref:zinc finger protein 862-like isoform X2 n=1 Tax=Argopecten irradians TaxID=31199 RepID=UPI003713CED2